MVALLAIDTQRGRIRRYVDIPFMGKRIRETGELNFQPWHPTMLIQQETLDALEAYRKRGALQ